MILLNVLHLILVANTVNCSIFCIFKAPATTAPVNNVIIEELSSSSDEIVEPVKPVIVLSETEDSEKHLFQQELAEQKRRSGELAAASRARYLAALPKEHDSMEMIAAEVSFTTQLMGLIDEQKGRMSKLWGQVKDIKYGHIQYSDSDAETEGYIVEEPAEENNTSSSSSSEKLDDEAYVRYFVGNLLERPADEKVEAAETVNAEVDEADEEDGDNFEVVENPNEAINETE